MIKLVSSNEVGANVKKANTDFGISILNMEYVMRNMSVFDSMSRTIIFWHHNKLLNNQETFS